MVLESLARIVKVQLPAYLKSLPLPESVGGFLRLTGRWGEQRGPDPLPAPLAPRVLWGARWGRVGRRGSCPEPGVCLSRRHMPRGCPVAGCNFHFWLRALLAFSRLC